MDKTDVEDLKQKIADTLTSWELVDFLVIPVEELVEILEDYIIDNIEDLEDYLGIKRDDDNDDDEI